MKTSLSLLVFLFPLALLAQKGKVPTPENFFHKNSIQYEFYGQGGYYSLRYERIYKNRKRLKSAYSVGGSYNFSQWTNAAYISSLVAENLYIIQINRDLHMDLSFGLAIWMFESDDPEYEKYRFFPFFTGTAGLRYQPNSSRYSVRVGVSPLVLLGLRGFFLYRTVFGLSVGYHF